MTNSFCSPSRPKHPCAQSDSSVWEEGAEVTVGEDDSDVSLVEDMTGERREGGEIVGSVNALPSHG